MSDTPTPDRISLSTDSISICAPGDATPCDECLTSLVLRLTGGSVYAPWTTSAGTDECGTYERTYRIDIDAWNGLDEPAQVAVRDFIEQAKVTLEDARLAHDHRDLANAREKLHLDAVRKELKAWARNRQEAGDLPSGSTIRRGVAGQLMQIIQERMLSMRSAATETRAIPKIQAAKLEE